MIPETGLLKNVCCCFLIVLGETGLTSFPAGQTRLPPRQAGQVLQWTNRLGTCSASPHSIHKQNLNSEQVRLAGLYFHPSAAARPQYAMKGFYDNCRPHGHSSPGPLAGSIVLHSGQTGPQNHETNNEVPSLFIFQFIFAKRLIEV